MSLKNIKINTIYHIIYYTYIYLTTLQYKSWSFVIKILCVAKNIKAQDCIIYSQIAHAILEPSSQEVARHNSSIITKLCFVSAGSITLSSFIWKNYHF